ncbi:hypothetical protein DNTS_021526 [Danionella cerebrum]|uniref:Uncharacterized protein n=1 Tax=Danionella cerebrum TaxID=2873325 RepID=A0A553QI94_9TELE|nr:hypothetical protein DNTS_021526 [Danionella translucida]
MEGQRENREREALKREGGGFGNEQSVYAVQRRSASDGIWQPCRAPRKDVLNQNLANIKPDGRGTAVVTERFSDQGCSNPCPRAQDPLERLQEARNNQSGGLGSNKRDRAINSASLWDYQPIVGAHLISAGSRLGVNGWSAPLWHVNPARSLENPPALETYFEGTCDQSKEHGL